MQQQTDFERFKNLSFEDFKALARDNSLSMYQKIGFPDSYRKDKEGLIFLDIAAKLGLDVNNTPDKILLDIGPGCSELPLMIIEHCKQQKTKILLVDSKEMLEQLPDAVNVSKYIGYFPDNVPQLINEFQNKVDYIIGYSIFHYIFYNTCIFRFIDAALSLLKPGGKLLLGDIPNVSKRRRFFSTETGIQFHQNFTGTDTLPEVNDIHHQLNGIDDGLLFGIANRYRNFGYEAYILPQHTLLPMSNRREDILICKI